jgi:hypothetical protein
MDYTRKKRDTSLFRVYHERIEGLRKERYFIQNDISSYST